MDMTKLRESIMSDVAKSRESTPNLGPSDNSRDYGLYQGLSSQDRRYTTGKLKEEPSKLESLLEAKNEKLNRLHSLTSTSSAEHLQQSLSDIIDQQVYTAPDGSKYQEMYTKDTQGNTVITKVPYTKENKYGSEDLRNLYIDNTAEGNMKLGLARSDKGFMGRYTPGEKYGWEAGPKGVQTRDGALLDVSLPYNVATKFEHGVHSNRGQIANRAIGQGPVTAEDTAGYGSGKTEYTTQNAPMWNQSTKTNVPLLKGTPFPKQMDRLHSYTEVGSQDTDSRTENLLDGLQYGVGKKVAGVTDAIVDAGGVVGKELYKMSTGATDEQAQKHFTKTMMKSFAKDYYNSKGDFVGADKYKTAQEYGYDPSYTEGAMKDLGKAWDSGSKVEMAKSVARNLMYAPEFIAESAGEFLTAPMRGAGIILNTFDYANKTLERRQEETGKEYTTLGDKALAGLTGWGQAVLNKLGGDEVIGRTKIVQSIVERVATMAPEKLTQNAVLNAAKRLGGALTVATGKGIYEGTEEVMQQFLDVVGARIGDDNANKIFSSEVGKELFQSFGAGFGAGAGLRAPMVGVEIGKGVMDTANTGLNKLSEVSTDRTAEDVKNKKAAREVATAEMEQAVTSRRVEYADTMTSEQYENAQMINKTLDKLFELDPKTEGYQDKVNQTLTGIDQMKLDMGFVQPTAETEVQSETATEDKVPTTKVEYENEEVQRAGIANVLTRSDKIKSIRIESVTGDTRVTDASTKKNKVMSVFSANDDVIQSVLDGKMDEETAAKMTNTTEGVVLNFAKRLGKKLGIKGEKGAVETLQNMNAKVSETMQNDTEAKTAIENLYGKGTTSQKALKVVAMVVDAVHSAMRSEHDISKKNKIKREGVSEARRQEVAHQLGKELMNSHELRVAGKPEETAKAYIELGENMLKIAEKAGYIESGLSDVALHNVHDMDGKRLSDEDAKAYYASTKKGTIQVPTVRVAGITDTRRGAVNDVTTASNVLSKLFKPINYEMPTEVFVDEVPTESKISKEHEKIIKDYNKLVYSVKPEALKVLREIKDYIDTAYEGDTDKALASDQILINILGLQKSDAEIRKDTEGGQAIGRKGTITNLLDNLEFIEQGGLHFNYESAINQRIHVMQTILDFQGDKYMARQILQGGSGEKKASGMARKLLLNTVADELKWNVEDVENVPSKTIQKYMDTLEETGSIPFNEMVKLQKSMKVKSPFKALSLLKVLSDIRKSNGGTVSTSYQVESDATASGVVNTLLNLSGHPKVQEILKLLGVGEMEKGTDPYNFIASVLEKSPSYEENIAPILDKLKSVGLDARSVAKYPIMKWFYGQLDKNNNADMGESITDDLVDLALYESNQKAMDLINEILGEKKYVIDTTDTAKETPIKDMTEADKKTVAEYYMKNIATEYTEALNVQFAEVSGYRKKMGSIYKMLNDSKQWNGTIRTAMDALLGSKTPNKMSVKKLKETVFKEDGTTYTTNKMMNNETSFNVNLQHTTDAALLLMSIKDILGDVVDSGVMTVHDALYSDPQTSLKIMERYNYYTKEATLKYDYMDAALQELNDVIKEMKDGALKDKYVKEYNAMKTENDVLMKEKQKWIEGRELNILGDWEVGNIQAKERAENGTKTETKAEPTVEEKNAEVYNDVKSIIEALKASNKDTVKSTLSRVVDLITVKSSHKPLVEMIKKALDDRTLAVMKGTDYEAMIKGIWVDTAAKTTEDPRFDSYMSNEDLVEVIAHEITHAYQIEYIYGDGKTSKEVQYLEKVLDRIQDLSPVKLASLSTRAQERISYVRGMEGAKALSELTAILSVEESVSNEIISAVTSNKERVLEVINKLIQKIKDWINSLPKERQSEIISKALSDNVITTGAIQAALNQLDANARVMSATTEFDESNHGVKLRAAAKTKDTVKDIPLNPLTAVNEAIAKTNRFTSDWMIIWADVIDEAVSPKVMKAHMKLKHASPLYREGISLLRTGFYDSEFAQKMHYLLGLAGDVTDQVIKKSLSLFTAYQQESAKEREAMAEMDRQLRDTYSKKDRVSVHQLFADTGIANLIGMPEVKMDLFNGVKTVEQLIDEVKGKIPADKVKDLDAVATEWVKGSESGMMVNVRQARMVSPEAHVYTTLKAISMIPNGEKLIKGMDKDLRNWMMSLAMLNKKLNDEINEMKLNYEGGEYSENKQYYAMYDGSYSMDIHEKVYEYRMLSVNEMRNSKYSEENGWVVIREGKNGVKGVVARESLSGGRVAGVGLEANRYANGAFLSMEQSKSVQAEIDGMSESKQIEFMKENKLVKDGNRFRILLPKGVKVDKLGLVQNAAHSLYRTYIHNKELIQSESIRKLMLEEGTHYVDSKAGMKKLEQVLRDNDRKGVRGQLGKRVEVKPFVNIDFSKEDLKDIKSFDELKKEYPMIAKYFKTPTGLTSFNSFNKQISLVKRGVSDVLLGHKNFSIFGESDNRELAKWENMFKKMIVLAKQKMVVTNPVKLMNDSITNIGVLSMMDIGIVEIAKGMKDGFRDYKEYAAERSKYVTYQMEAKMAQAMNEMEPSAENEKKAIWLEKKAKQQLGKLETLPFHDAFNYGFVQSYSTDLVIKEFDTITGIQQDIDTFIDKYTHDKKGNPNKLFDAIKWWQGVGFGMDDVFRKMGEIGKVKGTDAGTEMVQLADRLKNKKNDKESVARYLSDYMGSPASEMVNYGSAYMVLGDALSKYVLAQHLMEQENPRGERGKRKRYTKEEAYSIANDTFVDYRTNLPAEIKALSDYGIMMFPAFWMKIQRTIAGLIKYHPVSSALSYGIESMMGAESLNVMNQAIPLKFAGEQQNILNAPWEVIGPEALIAVF